MINYVKEENLEYESWNWRMLYPSILYSVIERSLCLNERCGVQHFATVRMRIIFNFFSLVWTWDRLIFSSKIVPFEKSIGLQVFIHLRPFKQRIELQGKASVVKVQILNMALAYDCDLFPHIFSARRCLTCLAPSTVPLLQEEIRRTKLVCAIYRKFY